MTLSRNFINKMSFIENLIIEKLGYYRETVLSRKPLHYREGFEKLISSSDFEKNYRESKFSIYYIHPYRET